MKGIPIILSILYGPKVPLNMTSGHLVAIMIVRQSPFNIMMVCGILAANMIMKMEFPGIQLILDSMEGTVWLHDGRLYWNDFTSVENDWDFGSSNMCFEKIN